MSTQPSSSEKQSFYDKKHRKIILKETLVSDPETSSSTNEIVSSSQDGSWTQYSWHKEGSAPVPQRLGKGKKAQKNRPQLKQSNQLQKKLEEALATPLQITKAESMMQKMGWQGGALGKSGTGIMEPVAPNAAYANKTRGFGQATHIVEPPAPKKKKMARCKLMKKTKRKALEIFHTNVLHQILKFVKNDYESEIVFDRHLSKGERKQIHHLVNEVINDNDVGSLDSVALMDLVQDIRAHNYYVLCTQSEGTAPNRFLCIFKEAPEHVYLIMPEDLREENDDVEEMADKAKENSTNNQNNKTVKNANKDLNTNEMLKEKTANVDENVLIEDKDNSQSLIKQSESIDENADKESNVPSTSSIHEVVEENSNAGNDATKEIEDMTKSNNMLNDIKITDNDNSNTMKSNNEVKDLDTKYVNTLNDSIKENANIDDNVKELKDNNESEKKDSIDITGELIEYFKEFAKSEEYSEMRFLGPFSAEEMVHINKLISNLYHHVNHNGDLVEDIYKDVFKGLDEERYIFEVKEDINWSPSIHKTDTYKGKRISTKGHLFFDIEET